MDLPRRDFLRIAGGAAIAGCAGTLTAREAPGRSVDAVAFDAFALFDPRPFVLALEDALPGRGAAIADAFRARVFDYGWLRALGGRYVDFEALSRDALDAALDASGEMLSAPIREALLAAWCAPPPWPDAVEGVRALARRGFALAALSNWSPRMLEAGLARAGIDDVVRALSTDAVRTYKPDPRAYALALGAFARPVERIAFVAFAGWDAAGASWFGFPTVWMNRSGAPHERLGAEHVASVRSFGELASIPMLS